MKDLTGGLQWQLNSLKDKYKGDRGFWYDDLSLKSKKIDHLETKVQVLEEEVKTANKREREVKNEIQVGEFNNEKQVLDMKRFHELTEEQANTIKALKKERQNLTSKVSALQKTVTEKNIVIGNKRQERAALKKEKNVSYL